MDSIAASFSLFASGFFPIPQRLYIEYVFNKFIEADDIHPFKRIQQVSQQVYATHHSGRNLFHITPGDGVAITAAAVLLPRISPEAKIEWPHRCCKWFNSQLLRKMGQ